MKFSILFSILLFCLIQVANCQTFTDGPIRTPLGINSNSLYEWIDADHDGDLDLLVFDGGSFYLYENQDEFFTKVPDFFTGTGDDYTYHNFAFGDYDTDGDIDFLIVKYGDLSVAVNNGDLTFTRHYTGIVMSSASPVHWLDLDGDADLDIVFNDVMFINSNGTYKQSATALPSAIYQRWWADINNDGLLDMICQRNKQELDYAFVAFINKGHEVFGDAIVLSSHVAENPLFNWFDADADHDLDLLISESDGTCLVLRNTLSQSGTLSFERQASIGSHYNPKAIITDADMDGLPDIIFHEDFFYLSKSYVFRNVSTSTALVFEKSAVALLSAERIRDMDIIDLNSDQKPDIFFAGLRNFDFLVGTLSSIYTNTTTPVTSAPAIPHGLQSEVKMNVELSWDHVNNGQAIYYSIEIRKDGQLYKAPLSFTDGTIMKTDLMKLSPSNKISLRDLEEGIYEWKVQAYDHAYRASGFSTQNTFEIMPKPVNLEIENVAITTSKLSWSYSGTGNPGFAVFRKMGNDSFTEIATVPAGVTNFVDENIPGNKLFSYYVTALLDGAYSGASNIVNYSTNQFVQIPFNSDIIEGRSISADFDLDGDYDIAIIGKVDGSEGKSGMLLNNGTGNYTYLASFLTADVSFGSISGRDMDNDGDTDICALANNNQSYQQLIIFKNNNNTFTKVFETPFYMSIPQYAIEDLNQDGRPDILFSHATSNGIGGPMSYQLLYHTDEELFVNSGEDFLPTSKAYAGTFIISDLNGDSFKDIVFSGHESDIFGEVDVKPRIYKNLGGSGFSAVPTSLPVLYSSNFKDFNGDGKVDLITGSYPISFYPGTNDFQFGAPQVIPVEMSATSFLNADMNLDGVSDIILKNDQFVRLLHNNGTGDFTEAGFQFDSNWHNILSLTDMENDGDIDLIKFGSNYERTVGKNFFYKNQTSNVLHQNAPPSAPASFQASTSITGIVFSWLPSSDDRSPQKSISYNLWITDSHGKTWLHPETNGAGTFLNRLTFGNTGYTNSFTLNNALPAGQYTAKVQAIDASFASSSWSTADFAILEGPSDLSIERILLNKIQLHWNNGPVLENKTLVLRKSIGSEFEIIAEVPAGTVSYTDVNLAYENIYTYKVIEVIGETLTGASNQESWNTNLLTLADVDFPDFSGSIDVGDYTGDGKMDIAIADSQTSAVFENTASGWISHPIAQPGNVTFRFEDMNGDFKLDLYRYQNNPRSVETFVNNGNHSFTSQSNMFTQSKYDLIDWWDYDMDNDLDAYIMLHYDHSSYKSTIIKNLSGGAFETGVVLCDGCNSIYYIYADFDRDGDEDRVEPYQNGYMVNLNGFKGLKPNATIEQNFHVSRGFSLDYNGDGWLDLLFLSKDNYYSKSTLYKNNGFDAQGNLNFQLVKDDFPTGEDLFVNWIDYDHDGDIDLFFMGLQSSIYVNKGAQGFQKQGLPSLGWGFKQSQWLDIDNDGDHDLVVPGLNMNRNVFINNLIDATHGLVNEAPGQPTNLQASVDSTGVYLQWVAGIDDHTSTAAQTFDIVLYKDGKRITKALVNPETGVRLKHKPGRNFGNAYFKRLDPGEYTWKVQAIDQSYAGSELSESGSFVIRPLQPVVTADTTMFYCKQFPIVRAKGENIEWFSDKEATIKIASGDFHAEKSQVVYVTQTVNGIKGYSKRVNITVKYYFPGKPKLQNVNPLPFCEYEAGFTATIYAEGYGVRWFADAARNTVISVDDHITIEAKPEDYYLTSLFDGCESEPEKLVVYEEVIESTVLYDDGKLITLEQNADYYEWSLNKVSIPHSNNYFTELKETGSYVVGILKGYCYEFSEPFIITATMEQTEKSELQIFPNPTAANFMIDAPFLKEGDITITDVSGRVIYESTITRDTAFDNLAIPSYTWKAGVYLITITNGEKKFSRKIIKL